MSNYKISVQNLSGADQNIAIYQAYPGMDGLSLVWLLKQINNGNGTDFKWEIDWALNWGTTDQPLAPGVLWTSSGPQQDMDPDSIKGNNAMGVTYKGGEFSTQPTAYHDPSVAAGSMQVKTDSSFNVTQGLDMSLAVYVDNAATFAMQSKPNGTFTFHTHPTYFICITDHKAGVAVDGDFVSSPTKVVFADGVTELSYQLDDELKFTPA